MHRRHFLYRDLKGENVLLDKDGYCVIVDLGFGKTLHSLHLRRARLSLTVPPSSQICHGQNFYLVRHSTLYCPRGDLEQRQVLCVSLCPMHVPVCCLLKLLLKHQNTGHDKSADLWSFGVLVYEMLTGKNPFYDEGMDQKTLFQRILSGKLRAFPDNCSISDHAIDLVGKLLVLDPKKRLGCLARGDLDLRDHPFFSEIDFCKLYRKEIPAPWVPDVKDPLDGSNFNSWEHLENTSKSVKELSAEEQQLFKTF
jgi:serine/threonine protein kinase